MSTMTKEHLNSVTLLHSYEEETDYLDIKEIASMFMSVNDRRLSFFVTFQYFCVEIVSIFNVLNNNSITIVIVISCVINIIIFSY